MKEKFEELFEKFKNEIRTADPKKSNKIGSPEVIDRFMMKYYKNAVIPRDIDCFLYEVLGIDTARNKYFLSYDRQRVTNISSDVKKEKFEAFLNTNKEEIIQSIKNGIKNEVIEIDFNVFLRQSYGTDYNTVNIKGNIHNEIFKAIYESDELTNSLLKEVFNYDFFARLSNDIGYTNKEILSILKDNFLKKDPAFLYHKQTDLYSWENEDNIRDIALFLTNTCSSTKELEDLLLKYTDFEKSKLEKYQFLLLIGTLTEYNYSFQSKEMLQKCLKLVQTIPLRNMSIISLANIVRQFVDNGIPKKEILKIFSTKKFDGKEAFNQLITKFPEYTKEIIELKLPLITEKVMLSKFPQLKELKDILKFSCGFNYDELDENTIKLFIEAIKKG